MKLQNVAFSMASNNYAHVSNKDNKENNMRAGKDKKTNNQQSAVNVVLSPKSSFDKMVENIQEQIQNIQDNEHYDADTKKSKIEELEKQLKEIQEAQRAQEAEVLQGKEKKSPKSNNAANIKTNADGDTLEIGLDTRAFIETGVNLDNLKNTYSMKKNLEGQSSVLKSEIKIDKSRGVNTEHKEAQLSKLTEGAESAASKLGEAIKNANTSANEQAKRTSSTAETSNENRADGNDNPVESTANVSNNNKSM